MICVELVSFWFPVKTNQNGAPHLGAWKVLGQHLGLPQAVGTLPAFLAALAVHSAERNETGGIEPGGRSACRSGRVLHGRGSLLSAQDRKQKENQIQCLLGVP